MRTSRSLAPLAGPTSPRFSITSTILRRAVVAEAQLALQPRRRAAPRVGDDAHGLVVQRVVLGLVVVVRLAVVVARLEDVLVVDGLALQRAGSR